LTEVNITKLSNTVVIDDESKIVTISAPGPQGADGGSMTSLSDTVILNPANKHLLYWESSSSKWKNAAIDNTYVSGLGTAAVKNTGTSQSSVIIGDDTRLSDPRTPTDHSADKVTTGTLGVDRIPALAASKITSGTLGVDRIPALSTDKLTSGTLPVGRGGTGLTSVSTLLNSNTTKSDVGLANVTNIVAQPVDADLTAIAGLTSAANKGIQFTGSGSAAVYDLTAAGKALLDDADAAAQRTTLGLGTVAVLAVGTNGDNAVQLTGHPAGTGALPAVSGVALTALNASNVSSGNLADAYVDLRVDHGVTFDGQGSAITSGKVVYVPVERAGVIKAATLVGDASGAITITITKYDPAADATTLGSAAAVGSIALATKIIKRDTTLSGWTLAVAEGDVLAFTTGGTIATVTRVTCKLKVELA
jgi:hypothetical protein